MNEHLATIIKLLSESLIEIDKINNKQVEHYEIKSDIVFALHTAYTLIGQQVPKHIMDLM